MQPELVLDADGQNPTRDQGEQPPPGRFAAIQTAALGGDLFVTNLIGVIVFAGLAS
jgi:hypothetical protein